MTTLAALSLHFPFVWYGFLLLFGLALGSFYNVVIYRLPRMLTQTADDERITLSTPGSSCPQCRQPIAWRDNIPLLSFLWLSRRARCCQAPIAWSYPLTELATGLLFILAGALLAPGLPLAGGLVLLSFLLILARIDARTQLLPDRLTLPLLWAGLLGVPVGGGPPASRPRREPSARRVVSKPGQAPPPPTGTAARPSCPSCASTPAPKRYKTRPARFHHRQNGTKLALQAQNRPKQGFSSV